MPVTAAEGWRIQIEAKSILLEQLDSIIAGTDHPNAENFDAEAGLDRWIETPAPAVGGSAHADLFETETGLREVE